MTALTTVRDRAGGALLAVGMVMVVVAYAGYVMGHRPGVSAAPPSPPSVTVSRTRPGTPQPSGTPTATSPSQPPRGGRVVAASATEPRTGGRRPSTTAPSGPAPRPTSPPVTTSCAVGVTVLALNACLRLETR